MPISDQDLEWIVRVALEARRRVKEQQKCVFKSEFRNTHFSCILGTDGVEQFVSTPELHSDEAIESDPLSPGQVWAATLGSPETGPGLYRIEVTCDRALASRSSISRHLRHSARAYAWANRTFTHVQSSWSETATPGKSEFSIQMRPMDADKSGAGIGVAVLVALCGSLLARNTRGGTIIAGALNLGGSIETIPNAVRIAELAIDKQARPY